MLSFEVLLPVGAAAFYLLDSMMLLYGNELAVERRDGSWTASLGSPLQFAARRVFIPNPFLPGALLFRLVWDADERTGNTGGAVDTVALRRELRVLRLIVQAQAVLLLFVLPPVSILLGAGDWLLAVFIAYYALTLLSGAAIVAKRRAYGLTARRAAALAVEALACAPFAVNLVRKISLRRSRDLAWLQVAREQFDPALRARIAADLSIRIDQFQVVIGSESAEGARLEALRTKLKERLDVAVAA